MPAHIVTLGGVKIPSLALMERKQNREWRFEEQRTVSDKTALQSTGKEPTTEDWELSLVASFCDPEGIKAALEAKMDVKKPEPLPMVWADGTMTGLFVIEKLSTTYVQKDSEGKVIQSKISLTLKQADAVAPKATPLQGGATPFKLSLPTVNTGVPFLDQLANGLITQATTAATSAATGFAEAQFRKLVGSEVANRLPDLGAAMKTIPGVFRTPGFNG
jgi:phage protein U